MRKSKEVAPDGLSWPEPERVPLSKVQLAPYNPRRMPPDKMRALKASIVKHGMVLNLVVQRRSEAHGANVLIGGHQRIAAARELCRDRGWPEPRHGWAVFRDCTDAVAKQLNVSLNNVGGEFDPHMLGLLLASVSGEMSDEDYVGLGLARDNVDELIRMATATPEDLASELEREAAGLLGFERAISLTIDFDSAADRDKAKAILVTRARAAKARGGSILLSALEAST